ncbi:MAG: hypothetical protein UHX00_04740 [Caryophanon sp.]|nr:hypothetical protein [Caryophanon sp.]
MKMNEISLNMIANLKVAKPIYAESFLYATPVISREQLHVYKEDFMRHVRVDRLRKVYVASHAIERWNERVGPYATSEQLYYIFKTIVETQHRRLKSWGEGVWCLDRDIVFRAKLLEDELRIITFYGRISHHPLLKNVHDILDYKQKFKDGLHLKLTDEQLERAYMPILPKMRTFVRGKTSSYLLEHFDVVGEDKPVILCCTSNEVTRKQESYLIDLNKPTERVLHRKVLNLLYKWGYHDFLHTYYETFDEAKIEKIARRMQNKVDKREGK